MNTRTLVVILVVSTLFNVLIGGSTLAGDQEGGKENTEPVITFSEVPPPGGGPSKMAGIAGKVQGEDLGRYKLVLYSRTDTWYVQPFTNRPFTGIDADGTWRARIHLGQEYAALLVDSSFEPRAQISTLPRVGGSVVAVAKVTAKE